MISSDEPGFYVEGKFGIRLETDIEVVEVPELVFNFYESFFKSFILFIYDQK